MISNLNSQWLIAVASLLLAASGCSKHGAVSSQGSTMHIEPGVGVGPIKLGMSMDHVKKALGEPSRTMGRIQEYLALGIAVGLDRDGSVGTVMMGDTEGGALTRAFKGTTKDGIGMGMSREKIVATHGQPERSQTYGADTESLRYDSGRLTFTLKGGKLVHIGLKR